MMLYPTTPEIVRRRRLIVGAAIAFLAIALLTYAVLTHRSQAGSPGQPAPAAGTPATAASDRSTPLAAKLPALPSTADPAVFARQIATAIFAWDTTTLITRTDQVELLVTAADPTGESTPGLVADLDGYLPTQDAWVELSHYRTRQWLSIGSLTTPGTWAKAKAQAGDELAPGTTALTIHGTRHRSGVWEGNPVASKHDVAFTVFVVCGPPYPVCHLLRLSMLDTPLD